MEEIKFYNVKVGTNTRAGNLNVLQSFVAKSDKDHNSVYAYYSNKYKGFGVSIEQVSEIVEDDIPNKESHDIYGSSREQSEINRLKSQIARLQKGMDMFSGTVRYDSVSAEVTQAFNDLSEKHKQYQRAKEEISSQIKSFLANKYGDKIVEVVGIGEWNHESTRIPFTARLYGRISASNETL